VVTNDDEEYDLFPTCRCRHWDNCDGTEEDSDFDRLERPAQLVFNAPPRNPELGRGQIGHFSFAKMGELCVCQNTIESTSTISSKVVECLDLWNQISTLCYLIRSTNGLEFYCTRFILDEAIKQYNKYREARLANIDMHYAMQLCS
jgi:hypothetical protein